MNSSGSKWVPLRPAEPPISGQTPGSPRDNSPPVKRRRVGVAIACDCCRQKKRRCNGIRPVCGACEQRGEECTYVMRRRRGEPNNDQVVEAVRLLNAMPAFEALHALDSVRNIADGAKILEMLQGDMHGKQRPSDISTAKSLTASSSMALELLARHPTMYLSIHANDYVYSHVSGIHPARLDHLIQAGSPRRLHLPETIPHIPPSLGRRRSLNSESVSSAPSNSEQSPTPPILPLRHREPSFCDNRLHSLSIRHWTKVEISDDLAARIISLYLRTDHPLLGFFAPDLFVADLVSHENRYCSSMLVNAMMHWACQMYSTIDPEAKGFVKQFRREIRALWANSPVKDSIINVQSAVFMSLGWIGQGKNHIVSDYLSTAVAMGTRLGLFGVAAKTAREKIRNLDPDDVVAASYTAWGVFNYITLLSAFYRQPGIQTIRIPPTLSIPGIKTKHTVDLQADIHGDGLFDVFPPMPHYMGDTFPYLCRFWLIMHDVARIYHEILPTLQPDALLQFAEYKFRELLVLGDSLPASFIGNEHKAHHTIIFRIWFHAAILDLFRPCLRPNFPRNLRLRTFASVDGSPQTVFTASLDQLKYLILLYRLQYRSSGYTFLWHTALLYVANAVLQETLTEDWLFYFLICLYGYERLGPSFPVTKGIIESLLTMCVRDNRMSSQMTRRIRDQLSGESNPATDPEHIMSLFAIDLELSASDPTSASLTHLAAGFEDHALMQEFTTGFDE